MRTLKLAIALTIAYSAAAATPISVGAFRSISLSNGGRVTVRYGAVQRVSIVDGDLKSSSIRVDRQDLIIESASDACARGYHLEVEVVTPHLDAVAVANGGTLQVLGAFRAQSSIDAAVEQGGTIDIRTIPADTVHAAVDSGGRIFLTSQKELRASVHSGGNITYWGNPDNVKRSRIDGGVITRGEAGERAQPLSYFGAELSPIPPIAPIPPTPPTPVH